MSESQCRGFQLNIHIDMKLNVLNLNSYLLTVSYCCRRQTSGISASSRRILIVGIDSSGLAGNITRWVELCWVVLPPIV